jgi:hypothetical protein
MRPQWPVQRHAPWDSFDNIQYDSEPVLSVEIDKGTWEEMFDLYESHVKDRKHPAVRDAWEKYQLVRAMVRQNLEQI